MFRVGQKVVCVNDDIPEDGWRGLSALVLNRIYTISGIEQSVTEPGEYGLIIAECRHDRYPFGGGYYMYHPGRFRPVVDISDLESIVTEVMRGKPRKIKDDQFDKQRVHSSAVPSQASRRRAATVPDAAAGRALPSMVLPAPLPSWRVSEQIASLASCNGTHKLAAEPC